MTFTRVSISRGISACLTALKIRTLCNISSTLTHLFCCKTCFSPLWRLLKLISLARGNVSLSHRLKFRPVPQSLFWRLIWVKTTLHGSDLCSQTEPRNKRYHARSTSFSKVSMASSWKRQSHPLLGNLSKVTQETDSRLLMSWLSPTSNLSLL